MLEKLEYYENPILIGKNEKNPFILKSCKM